MGRVKLTSCTSCGSCATVCPVHAITMTEDSQGFSIPSIADSCLDCGKCLKACPIENDLTPKEPLAYGAIAIDDDLRMESQSGGAFASLALSILEDGGVVYGVALFPDMSVAYKRITDKEQLSVLKKSKYVFCPNDRRMIARVAEDLKNGLPVLYSGASCQIAGLLSILQFQGVSQDKLITVDLICHGGMSPLLWKENVRYVESESGTCLIDVDFRSKETRGYSSPMMTYRLQDASTRVNNYFMELYYLQGMYASHCYKCHFADSKYKMADITLADFHGVRDLFPDFGNDDKGISLVLVHSDKGGKLFNSTDLLTVKSDYQNAIRKNVSKPPIAYKASKGFWDYYRKNGFDKCLKKYTSYGRVFFKVKRKMLSILGCWE